MEALNWWLIVEAAYNAFRNRHAPHIPPWTHVTPQEKASWLTIVTTVTNVVAPFGVGGQRQIASWQEQLDIEELRKIIRKGERDLLEAERLLRDKEQENRALGQVLKLTREQLAGLAERPKLPVNTPVNRSGRFESVYPIVAKHTFHIGPDDFLRKIIDDDEPVTLFLDSDEQWEILRCILESMPEMQLIPGPGRFPGGKAWTQDTL